MTRDTGGNENDKAGTSGDFATASSLKKLVARAKKSGIVTYEELSKALPQDQMSSEQVEDIMSVLSEMGVSIVEEEPPADDVDLQDPELQRIAEILKRPQPEETLFDLIEKNPPTYDPWWNDLSMWRPDVHPASCKLTASFRELQGTGRCGRLTHVREAHFPEVCDDQQLSASDAQAAGCDFDAVFWATGMLSAYSPGAATRLSEFAADCLQILVDRVERDRPERRTLLNTVRATRDFATGKCSVNALLRETAKAQQAWMRLVVPTEAGIRFPWIRFFSFEHQWPAAAFLPPMWEEWAKGVAWAVATCLTLRPYPGVSDDAWERRDEHEAWLLAQLVHRFVPERPPVLPSHLDGDSLIGTEKPAESVVRSLELDGPVFAVLPDDIIRIESVSASNDVGCHLPFSLRSIGSLSLYRCQQKTVTVPGGVVDIDAIDVDESYLVLPESVERVGRLSLHLYDDCFGCDGVRVFGPVELHYANFTFPEGVETIKSLKIQASATHLPASLKFVGDVFVDDENRDNLAEEIPARTLHWQEGPAKIGALELGEEIRMVLPKSIQSIASVRLASGAHLKMSQETVISGQCELAETAVLERLPAS